MIRLLLPPLDEMHGRFSDPWLQRLARGSTVSFSGFLSAADWPFVAASFAADVGSVPDTSFHWLRLDPATAAPDINGVRMLAFGEMLNISGDEHTALAASVSEYLNGLGMRLEWPTPARAYAGLPVSDDARPLTSPTWEVLGEDLLDFFPQDTAPGNARGLRSLLTNLQVELNDHPVNHARRTRGQPLINLLWPWADQASGDAVTLRESWLLISPDPDWRAVWTYAGGSSAGRDDVARVPSQQDVLIDLRDQKRCSSVEREWLEPLFARERGRLQLQFGERVIQIAPLDRFKFWRKA